MSRRPPSKLSKGQSVGQVLDEQIEWRLEALEVIVSKLPQRCIKQGLWIGIKSAEDPKKFLYQQDIMMQSRFDKWDFAELSQSEKGHFLTQITHLVFADLVQTFWRCGATKEEVETALKNSEATEVFKQIKAKDRKFYELLESNMAVPAASVVVAKEGSAAAVVVYNGEKSLQNFM